MRAWRGSGASALAVAIGLTAASAAAAQSVAIVGGTVHTVAGPPLDNGVVLIEDGRITAVGPAGQVAIPAAARRVDAAGKVVTPGLFDAATQIGLVEVGSLSSTRDGSLDRGAIRTEFRVSDALNPRSMVIPVVRTDGVTTAVAAPTGGVISGQGAMFDLIGPSRREMVVEPSAAVYANLGPGASADAGGSRGGVLLELRSALDRAREAAESDAEPGRDVEPLVRVLRGVTPLVARASGAGDIESALDLAEEYDLRLVVDGGEEAWMLADRLAGAQVPVILYTLENRPTQFDRLGTRFDAAALLSQAGVPVVLTTRSAHGAGQLPHVAGNAVRYGMSWSAALEAVTLAPARAFGMSEDYGTLEPGKVANVVVWSDDPFEFAGYAERVFVRGQEVAMDSRQRRLFERYRSLEGRLHYKGMR